jgi:hypothetical protein
LHHVDVAIHCRNSQSCLAGRVSLVDRGTLLYEFKRLIDVAIVDSLQELVGDAACVQLQ